MTGATFLVLMLAGKKMDVILLMAGKARRLKANIRRIFRANAPRASFAGMAFFTFDLAVLAF